MSEPIYDLDLPSSPLEGPVELTNCDREPLHIPAAVQDHGVLLVADRSRLQLLSVSENAADIFGLPTDQLLRASLGVLLPEIQPLLQSLDEQVAGHKQSLPQLQIRGWEGSCTVHLSGQQLLVELEGSVGGSSLTAGDIWMELFGPVDRMDTAAAFGHFTKTLRKFIAFDRVMLYRFEDDHHGVVVAEDHRSDLEPYQGLHYPATDIPQPARRLYVINTIRSLADVRSQPVSMTPRSLEGGQSIDMTHCDLRAISPIHVEYLNNMQVAASMSISIIIGGRLWGLMACHHLQPRRLSFVSKQTCRTIGQVLSSYIASRLRQDRVARQLEAQSAIASEIEKFSRYGDLSDAIERSVERFAELLQADGVAWRSGRQSFSWGVTPNDAATAEIFDLLAARGDEPIAYSEQLSLWMSSASSYSDRVCGLMALRMGEREGGTLIFFRRPYLHSVDWAGNPSKSLDDEAGRLSPRKSFDKFRVSVNDRSLPWTDDDRQTAGALLQSLRMVAAEHSARLRRVNDELRQVNGDLDAFTYAVGHDLREPLRSLRYQLDALQSGDGASPEAIAPGLARIERIATRMDELLEGLLRFSRAGRSDLRLETVSLAEVVGQLDDILFVGRDRDVEVKLVGESTVHADFSCLREILVNLVTNAIKYNRSEHKRVEIGVIPTERTPLAETYGSGHQAIYVRDNGIGIAGEHFTQIFEIFRRLHPSDHFGGGTGAGLTIVRRLVERHGGRITLESDDSGTAFYFTLEPPR